MPSRFTMVICATMAAGILRAAQIAPGDLPTVWHGAYTTQQAQRGESAFLENCSSCHAEDLNGSPPLKGPRFMDNWREDTLERLFTHMKTTMPRDGTRLADSLYLDILAFILRGNAFPEGAEELTLASVNRVRLVGKDGPMPLPSLATVLVVGCLERDSSGTWTLTRATEPVRTGNPRETNAEELKVSELKSLGSSNFRLQNLQSNLFNPTFNPERSLGQKVQIKGVLVRQQDNDRINVIRPDAAAMDCAR